MQVQNEMIVVVYLKGTYTIVALAKPITIVSTSLLESVSESGSQFYFIFLNWNSVVSTSFTM